MCSVGGAYKKGTEISYLYSKKVECFTIELLCELCAKSKIISWFVQGERKVFLSERVARPATVFAF